MRTKQLLHPDSFYHIKNILTSTFTLKTWSINRHPYYAFGDYSLLQTKQNLIILYIISVIILSMWLVLVVQYALELSPLHLLLQRQHENTSNAPLWRHNRIKLKRPRGLWIPASNKRKPDWYCVTHTNSTPRIRKWFIQVLYIVKGW